MRAWLYKPDVGRLLAQHRFESARGDLNLHNRLGGCLLLGWAATVLENATESDVSPRHKH